MRKARFVFVLFACLTCAGADQNPTLHGRVVAVDYDNQEFTIREVDTAKEKTITYTDKTTFSVRGEKVDEKYLEVGREVFVDCWLKSAEAIIVKIIDLTYRTVAEKKYDQIAKERKHKVESVAKIPQPPPVVPVPVAYPDPPVIIHARTEARTESPYPKTVQVRAYTRKDGTYVPAHSRSAPRR